MPKLIPMCSNVQEEPRKPKRHFDTHLDADNYDGYNDIPIPPKKVKSIKGFNLDSQTREKFIQWLLQRSQEPNPPTQLKRMIYKDGGFRESIPRGFLDLILEFVESGQ